MERESALFPHRNPLARRPVPPVEPRPVDSEAPKSNADAQTLRDISPAQWKSGIAAWLGWTFDGLDMQLYTLVAARFVAQLLMVDATNDPNVQEKSGWIQAAFLVGWALGGAFFGRIGDLMGRSKALSLTILTYSAFTGLSAFAQSWWQLFIFRFLAALGIGGEWAVGSSLLSETWPRRWGPWIAAILQTGVNLGVLIACATTWGLAGVNPRWVFLVGILPALLVLWIRKNVPEPAEWHAARNKAKEHLPRVRDLFRGAILGTTLKTILVCAFSLSPWWAFQFWHVRHLEHLKDLASWSAEERQRLTSFAFSTVMAASIAGNFFSGFLASRLGFRKAIIAMCALFFFTMAGTFSVERDHVSFMLWIPWVGFSSGVFGLFTMYLPPLFPTLLRTTGAGFCYNVGRIASAFGTVFAAQLTSGGDFRPTLFFASFLFLVAGAVALTLPDRARHAQPQPP